MDVKTLLEEWGIADEHINNFIDQGFDELSLQHVRKEDIGGLIPVLGQRIRFEVKHAEWVKGLHREPSDLNGNVAIVTEPDIPAVLLEEDEETAQMAVDSQPARANNKRCTRAQENGTASGQSKRLKAYDIEVALDYSKEGKIVLGAFKKKKILTPHNRDQLTSAILDYELKDDANKVLTRKRLEFLADEIVSAFSAVKEKKDTYFVQYRSAKDDKLITKGKLPNKYYNDRRKFQNSGYIEPKTCRTSRSARALAFVDSCMLREIVDSEDPDDPMPSETPAMIWLKDNRSDWNAVLSKWDETHEERMKSIFDLNIRAYEYAKLFPALYSKNGYQLLVMDFDKMYPDCSLALYTNWAKFSAFVQHKVPKVFTEVEQLSADQLKNLVLMHAPDIFEPIPLDVTKGKGKKKKEVWKPSKAMTRDAFFLHVENVGELTETLDKRRDLLATHKLHLQPLPVIVGPARHPTQFIVVLDRYFFEVESAMKAVETAFKMMFAIHAKFPPDAKQIWTFIQKAVFGFDTSHDEPLPTVSACIAEYECFEL